MAIAGSAATADKADADEMGKAQSEYERASAALTMRSRAQVERFFEGLELAGRRHGRHRLAERGGQAGSADNLLRRRGQEAVIAS